ncbi:hypothetical protein [Flammeovirga kamogawensis]|uniref:Porin family protein n=1 Tax=Flammeovirga kamogawensis TaxID=373891 RepID=A0ABX8GSC4_9BACT|nr:hypothetical protein [Flammeovirga kamogawensis]MBB6462698.1 hypothetical protein [Flammeovirga kamogawensis]QWG06067.1 hypothetical protein KM029_11915 [Flammeovirga kamogawensis]TRX67900.1 hypothetical protein EO216_06940 [Flammeovirga kamogawensis]
MNLLFRVFLCFIFLLPTVSSAQLTSIPSSFQNKKNTIGFASSYGEQLDRNAYFYGFSLDYGRRIKDSPFSIGTVLMWDNEIEKKEIIEENATFSVAVTVSYAITKKWSIGTGIGKGVMENDNPQKEYQWVNGDWSTGIISSYQFNLGGKVFNVSASYEYNITQKETSFSIDLGYVLPF